MENEEKKEELPEVQTPAIKASERGRPESEGSLSGDDMQITWKVWPPAEDLLGMLPVAIEVTFKPDDGSTYKCTGEFSLDPIAFQRRVKNLKDWDRWLVQMAAMAVVSARRAESLQ